MRECIHEMTTWAAYFDSARDDSPLYRVQAALYLEALTAAVEVHAGQRVLDFGCGFGLVAALLAPRVGEVWVWDQSPNMCAVAERTTACFANVRSCDLSARHQVDLQPYIGSMDLILVNSVAQYTDVRGTLAVARPLAGTADTRRQACALGSDGSRASRLRRYRRPASPRYPPWIATQRHEQSVRWCPPVLAHAPGRAPHPHRSRGSWAPRHTSGVESRRAATQSHPLHPPLDCSAQPASASG